MTGERQGGFTRGELVIVVALMAATLAAVWNVSVTVTSNADSDSLRAEVASSAQEILGRVGGFARPAKMTTIRVQAVEQDVAAGFGLRRAPVPTHDAAR